jgi:hypothetical protein
MSQISMGNSTINIHAVCASVLCNADKKGRSHDMCDRIRIRPVYGIRDSGHNSKQPHHISFILQA